MMPMDGLTHLLALNKHSIDFNYCYCIKQTQQVFQISKWWKNVHFKYALENTGISPVKILNNKKNYTWV